MTDLAVHALTAPPEQLEAEEREWEAAHPELAADLERFKAEQAVWDQAKADGRVKRYYVPPKEDNWDDGPFRDNWGHFEERINDTDWVRDAGWPGVPHWREG